LTKRADDEDLAARALSMNGEEKQAVLLPIPERTFDAALVSLGLSLGTAGTDTDKFDVQTSTSSENNVIEAPY
jgi:hypothetical protein